MCPTRWITRNLDPLPCRIILGQLNGSRCNSSSTEAGVLIAYHQATARPLPKEVRTITGGGTRAPPLLFLQGKRMPAYLATHPFTRDAPRRSNG
ncbi:hypothetical protein AVEN_208488-1 [Araneus ventricosus]|uniref:Uncharacterized protein n=1 Tax=Araneus ventricosus TaxID=182803 RepID=A0A4Y2UV11_ARAVE|nr:hypothetical protein AVEN_208488-1 [Araneus ventricosus]